jgi:Zn-finger domain-containing protein
MGKVVYLFYFTSSEIIDHDEDGAVYSDVRNNLGAFYDLKSGLEYYQYKYPSKTIQYNIIQIMDAEE